MASISLRHVFKEYPRSAKEKKQEQEKNSLLNIKDFFKKIIIVKDDIKRKRDENGIVTMSIYDFLLDEESLEY